MSPALSPPLPLGSTLRVRYQETTEMPVGGSMAFYSATAVSLRLIFQVPSLPLAVGSTLPGRRSSDSTLMPMTWGMAFCSATAVSPRLIPLALVLHRRLRKQPCRRDRRGVL